MPVEYLKFGAFLAPFHALNENPTLCLERDMQLITLMDTLCFDEAWIGEHHSVGSETIASPELFIAAVAERTKHIRLGTGVVSLSYHHPLMVANRMVQLDHQTRGRVMFGVGPGQLAVDAHMLGLSVQQLRPMMSESLEVICQLLNGEVVNKKTDWFTLCEARLHLMPYQKAGIDMAVASAISPSGARAAGKHGLGLLSVAASSAAGNASLTTNWDHCEAAAQEQGQQVSRDNWRLVIPMHIAETREQAIEDLRFGLMDLIEYAKRVGGDLMPTFGTFEHALETWMTEGIASFGVILVGTPDDAIRYIEMLQEKTGGFGSLLLLGHNCADFSATQKSYEMLARYVMPHFQGSNRGRAASARWAQANQAELTADFSVAMSKAFEEGAGKNE